jgi:hypothetical protein
MNDQTLSAKKEKAVADYIIQMVCIDSGSDRTIVGFTSTYANVRPMGSIHPSMSLLVEETGVAYREKTTNLSQVTNKQFHIKLHQQVHHNRE